MCVKHSQAFYRHGDPLADFSKKRNKCTIEECENWAFGNGLCSKHYSTNIRHGNPNHTRANAEERYHLAYSKTDGCWNWIKGTTRDGYGKFTTCKKGKKTTWIASRFGWILLHGEIPKGMLVCHTCDNPLCQNPAHLFLGTPKDNMLDKVKKGRLVANPYRNPTNNRFAKKPI